MKENITLSNGRIVAHKVYHEDAIEAYMLDGGEMSNDEWIEYCKLTYPKTKVKLTWDEIKQTRK